MREINRLILWSKLKNFSTGKKALTKKCCLEVRAVGMRRSKSVAESTMEIECILRYIDKDVKRD